MPDRRALVAAELALGALTLAAVLGMGRLFAEGDWFWPFVANAVVAHALLALIRRRGGSLAVAGAACAVGAAVTVALTVYPGSTVAGIPTGETLDLLDADLTQAWEAFKVIVAPAPVLPGFVVATAVALWFVAFVADWAAFRLWVPFEATLPAGTLFVFTALLGTSRGRGWSTALFAGAVLGFLLLHRVTRQEATSHWVAGRGALGRRALVGMGASLALVAVLAGVVVGPSLPGADADAIVDTRGLTNDERRVTISPLVDIRARLVDQPDVVVFRVQSTRRAYWRITSLDQFDGGAWTSGGRYGEADGSLPEGVETEADTDSVTQHYRIDALAQIWLPAAYEPAAIAVEEGDARYDEDSATLIVDEQLETSDRLSYEVRSSVPRFSAEQLRSAPPDVDDEIADRYLELPEGFSPEVVAEAQRVTAGATTPYDQALALQDHLRSFTYDLEVARGHGIANIEQFLFESQRGYCEQFAGTYAAMARAIGLPSRVAVGFTPGSVDPADPDDPAVDDDPVGYVVRGENAHAWPEVYLEGYGWVAFEPTPGRGAPFAEQHTGVSEAQAAPGDPTGTSVPTTAGTATTDGGSATTQAPGSGELEIDDPLADLGTETAGDQGGGKSTWSVVGRWVLRLVVLPLALGTLLYVGLLLLVHRLRRRAPRRPDPAAAVHHAWRSSLDELAVVGVRSRADETHGEVAARVARELPPVGGPIQELARLAETASWAPAAPSDDDAAHAADAQGAVATLVRARTSRLDRLTHVLRSETVVPRRDDRRHVDSLRNR